MCCYRYCVVSRLVPSLGEHWAHGVATRLLLYYGSASTNGGMVREGRLLKSPSLPPKVVQFAVTHKGLRDVPPTASTSTGTGAIAAQQGGEGGVLGKRRL